MSRKFIKVEDAIYEINQIIGIEPWGDHAGNIVLKTGDPRHHHCNMHPIIALFIKLGDIEVYEAQ